MRLPLPALEFATSGSIDPDLGTFLRKLAEPCWIRIRGRDRTRLRAMTTLLHGNEPSGVRALHRFLRDGLEPATDILALVANVRAALEPPAFTHRMLPGHPDLNRCFTGMADGDDGRLADGILRSLHSARPEALVDLHNTSGDGPAYGVAVRADPAFRALVSRFATHFVLTGLRLGALMEATAADFPTVTVECGGAGSPHSDATASAGLERYFRDDDVLAMDDAADRVTVIERPLRIRLAAGMTVAYAATPVEGRSLTLRPDIDRFNTSILDPGEPIGWSAGSALFDISGRDGPESGHDLFESRGGRLYARTPLRLFMATTDAGIAASDCLFYAVPL